MQSEMNFQTLLKDARALSIAAFVLLLLGLFLPGLSVSVNMFGMAQSQAVPTMAVVGLVSWLIILIFAAAVAARFAEPLKPFTKMFDMAAIGCFGLGLLIYVVNLFAGASTGDPLADKLVAEMTSIYPSIGILPYIASIVPLVMAMRLAPTPAGTMGETSQG